MVLGGGVLADPPSWLDLRFVRTASAVLAVVAVVILVAVVIMVRSLAARLVVIVLAGTAVFGLLHYREQLNHCDKQGCECVFFGENLQGGGCSASR